MSATTTEINSQPQVWRQVADLDASVLPSDGARVAIVGCGTSWFMAQAYAHLREGSGRGITDVFTAVEFPEHRDYDALIFLSRSGTTTEIIDLLRRAHDASVPSLLITAVAGGPGEPYADHEVVLDFADETSVVQTRFATAALTYLRESLGHDLRSAADDAQRAIDAEIPQSWIDAEQISFLGGTWTIGLANEAALKLREASQSWTEAYYYTEYRHGPISIAQPGRLVWSFEALPEDLVAQISETGAELVTFDGDPQASLVLAQRLAVARAQAFGLDPDRPRHLTRAVILS